MDLLEVVLDMERVVQVLEEQVSHGFAGGDAVGGCEGPAKVDGECVRVGKSGDCPEDGKEYICVRREYGYKRGGNYESSFYGGCVEKTDQKMGCGDKKSIDNVRGVNNQ